MAELWFHRLALLGTVLTLAIVMSGAWVRLTDAGLGCPDWPGCYGQLTPPDTAHEIRRAEAAFPDAPVEVGKAWREMMHRYAIPFLGLVVLLLAGIAIVNRDDPFVPLIAPLVLLPLLAVQAILGMLTVTMLLQPIVVVAHLLGGMTTLGLLGYLALRTRPHVARILPSSNRFRGLSIIAIAVLMAQIALGGWTSANYAALACPDFPGCQGQLWPEADFAAGFVPWRGLGSVGYSESAERTAIHLAHRIGALVTTLVLVGIGLGAAVRGPHRGVRVAGGVLAALVVAQVALGAMTVLLRLPLVLAVAHNGMAALLVLSAIALFVAAWRQS